MITTITIALVIGTICGMSITTYFKRDNTLMASTKARYETQVQELDSTIQMYTDLLNKNTNYNYKKLLEDLNKLNFNGYLATIEFNNKDTFIITYYIEKRSQSESILNVLGNNIGEIKRNRYICKKVIENKVLYLYNTQISLDNYQFE